MNLNKEGIRLSRHIIFLLCIGLISCDPTPAPDKNQSAEFETPPLAQSITPGVIDEASGIAPSINLPGNLWTQQDSGQPNSVYLLSQDGKTIKEYKVPGSLNHDWEDIAVGVGPESGTNYIYLADIGNNNLPMTDKNIIYRVPELKDVNGSFSEGSLAKITFSYPDGPRDAESILLDPVTKDIFIISKELDKANLYRLASPQSVTETIVAEKIGTVPSVTIATAGDISADGSEILVRNYFAVYYWQRKSGETIGQTLRQKPTKQLTVAAEPQGEGICFDREAKGFYTLSEKGSSTGVSLNYYKKK